MTGPRQQLMLAAPIAPLRNLPTADYGQNLFSRALKNGSLQTSSERELLLLLSLFLIQDMSFPSW